MATTSHLSLDRRIEVNPFDVEAWTLLLNDYQTGPVSSARPFYKKIVIQFPNSALFIRKHIEHELREKCFENVEELFQKHLTSVPDVDLWKCYIYYIKEKERDASTKTSNLMDALEMALEYVGNDMNAFRLYQEFVDCIKTKEYETESERAEEIRKVYHTALTIPMVHLDQIYHEYKLFEEEYNDETSADFILSGSQQFTQTVVVFNQIQAILRDVNKATVSVPLKGTETEEQQLEIWKQYIEFELANPLELKNKAIFLKRIIYIHDQCLLNFAYSIDIWLAIFEFETSFLQDLEKNKPDSTASGEDIESYTQLCEGLQDEIIDRFTNAIKTFMKEFQVLHFGLATFLESYNKIDMCEQVYTNMLENPTLQKSLVYIHYMHFANRHRGIRAQRDIFTKARADPRLLYQVYVAAALIEYSRSQDATVSIRIFELGKQRFATEIEFMVQYVKFIQKIGDDNNLRVLFEQIVSSEEFGPAELAPIWELFVRQEKMTGDPYSLAKVERRRRLALEKHCRGKEIHLMLDREIVNGLIPMSAEDLEDLDYPAVIDYDQQDAMSAVGVFMGEGVCYVNEKCLPAGHGDDRIVDLDLEYIGNDSNIDVAESGKVAKALGLVELEDEGRSRLATGDVEMTEESPTREADDADITNPKVCDDEVFNEVMKELLVDELGESSDEEAAQFGENETHARTRRYSFSSTGTEYAESEDQDADDESDSENTGNQNDAIQIADHRSNVTHVPDVDMMIPYAPIRNTTTSMHVIPGGIFPPPPSVLELMRKIPPSNTFVNGPFIKTDSLFELILDFGNPKKLSTSVIGKKKNQFQEIIDDKIRKMTISHIHEDKSDSESESDQELDNENDQVRSRPEVVVEPTTMEDSHDIDAELDAIGEDFFEE
uniref:Suf domain-containing protein n=1 Tax=Rhabditophanes sp. KR3021 TaxID=114890 RepID=A0AC35TKG6_9BILA